MVENKNLQPAANKISRGRYIIVRELLTQATQTANTPPTPPTRYYINDNNNTQFTERFYSSWLPGSHSG